MVLTSGSLSVSVESCGPVPRVAVQTRTGRIFRSVGSGPAGNCAQDRLPPCSRMPREENFYDEPGPHWRALFSQSEDVQGGR